MHEFIPYQFLMDNLFDGVAHAIRGASTKGHGVPLRSVGVVRERSLPKTSSGKVMRRLYEKSFADAKLDVLHQADFGGL